MSAPACERMRMRWQGGACVAASLVCAHVLLTRWLAGTPAATRNTAASCYACCLPSSFFLLPPLHTPFLLPSILRTRCVVASLLRVVRCGLSNPCVAASRRRAVAATRTACLGTPSLPPLARRALTDDGLATRTRRETVVTGAAGDAGSCAYERHPPPNMRSCTPCLHHLASLTLHQLGSYILGSHFFMCVR